MTQKNYIITEWGASAQADSSAAPRAEGGFFREMGSMAYGMYLGNNGAARTVTSTSTTSAFLNHQNALDLVLAGDAGLKWGARLHYANSKDEQATTFERKNSAFGLGFGISHGDMEAYVNSDLSDKSTGAKVVGDEWNRKPSVQIGASYKWSGMTFFADMLSTNNELKGAAGSDITVGNGGTLTAGTAGTITNKVSNLTFGASRVHEVNPGARVITTAQLNFDSTKVGGSVTTTENGTSKNSRMPVLLAFEADATSWLVLRGSVSQNILLGETKSIAGKKVSIPNSTALNAGATLNFGKLKVDGVVGTTAATRGGAAAANQGVLATDNLMTRVGVHYWF